MFICEVTTYIYEMNVKKVRHVWNGTNVPDVFNVFERSERLPKLPDSNFGRRSRQTFFV